MRVWTLLGLALLSSLSISEQTGHASQATLRVCTDPNNLPYSNARGEGFEDKLAALLAHELGMRVEHTYWAQRRGFFRNTLKAQRCDVVMGVPTSLEMVLTTRPYYRSGYVFVERAHEGKPLRSLNDPRLRELTIGVPVVGDDYANPPPVHALSRRGIVDKVVGFSVFGDYRQESPPLRLVRAVADGKVDVAIAWGPQAGYVAKHARTPLQLTPVEPSPVDPEPFTFEIALGVRHADVALRNQLDDLLKRKHKDIEELLRTYGVPLL